MIKNLNYKTIVVKLITTVRKNENQIPPIKHNQTFVACLGLTETVKRLKANIRQKCLSLCHNGIPRQRIHDTYFLALTPYSVKIFLLEAVMLHQMLCKSTVPHKFVL